MGEQRPVIAWVRSLVFRPGDTRGILLNQQQRDVGAWRAEVRRRIERRDAE